LPNAKPHPTWSQYVCAFAVLATAWFEVGPLTGQPVSVIQTGLPPETPTVFWYACSNRAAPVSIPLAIVFWKYGYASVPIQSTALTTAEFEPLTQAVQVST